LLAQAALLRCVPLWALILNNFTFHYAFFILMSWLPTLYDTRGADPTQMGSLKMVPYLIMGAPPNNAHIACPIAAVLSACARVVPLQACAPTWGVCSPTR
jgi:cyanate permease